EYGRWRGWIANDLSRSIHNAEWWLTYEAWRVICCSRFMAGEVEIALRVPTDKVTVIPNGVDTRRFDALVGHDLSDFRACYASPNQKILFYVGRVTFEKGVHLLVDAMPRLLSAGQRVKLAYQMVVGQYNWQAIARKTIDVYQQVATERKQSTWV